MFEEWVTNLFRQRMGRPTGLFTNPFNNPFGLRNPLMPAGTGAFTTPFTTAIFMPSRGEDPFARAVNAKLGISAGTSAGTGMGTGVGTGGGTGVGTSVGSGTPASTPPLGSKIKVTGNYFEHLHQQMVKQTLEKIGKHHDLLMRLAEIHSANPDGVPLSELAQLYEESLRREKEAAEAEARKAAELRRRKPWHERLFGKIDDAIRKHPAFVAAFVSALSGNNNNMLPLLLLFMQDWRSSEGAESDEKREAE